MMKLMPCLGAGVMLVLLSVGITGAPAAPQSTQPAAAAEAPKTHVAQAGDLVLRVEREGRIDSARRAKVRLIPDAFNGPYEVVEVVKRNGRVSKGDVILRLQSEGLEKELDNARMALDHARRGLALLQQEAQVQQQADVTRLEQTGKAKERAAKELGIWEKYEGPNMLKSAELSLQSSEFRLADQRQELDQLEAMYKGTHLANQTKEIVLDRARRDLKTSEQWLLLTKDTNLITREVRHPQKDKDVRDTAVNAAQEDAHARINTSAAEQRKSMELEKAEKSLKDAEERYSKLQADAKLLTVTAPFDGVMTNIDLEPRDQVNGRQTICEVLDPAQMIVKFPVTAEDLRVLESQTGTIAGEGAQLALLLPEYPDLKITGTVKEVAQIGTAGEGGTQFPLTVALKCDSPLARIGLRCKLNASRTLADVLTVPRNAVKWENGEAHAKVQTASGAETRTLTVGAGNDKMITVISGLSAGDEVLIEEAPKK